MHIKENDILSHLVDIITFLSRKTCCYDNDNYVSY